MPYETDGTLTTDKRTVDDTTTWDTQIDWEAYQSVSNVEIINGSVQLSDLQAPDSQDLRSRYDFSEQTSTTEVIDQTGNGNTLTEGTFTGLGASINGLQAGDFDGVDDYMRLASWTSISQPFTLFAAFRYESVDTSVYDRVIDGATLDEALLAAKTSDNAYSMNSSTLLSSSTVAEAGDIVVLSALFNGTNSVLRANGTQIASGDAGTSSMDGVTLGASYNSGAFDYAEISAGEFLIYPMDKSAIFADVETYLTDKWGPTTTL